MGERRELLVPPDQDETLINDPRYKVVWPLANGSRVEMRLFDRRQQRWIFEYDYREYPDATRRGRPDMINKVCLVVDYLDGLVIKIELLMRVIFPARLGQVFFAGVDISPGADTFFQFAYERVVLSEKENDFLFRLVEVQIGARPPIDLRPKVGPKAQALMRPVNFPFPVCDQIIAEYGQFKVPFLDNNGQEQHFAFPKSIVSQ